MTAYLRIGIFVLFSWLVGCPWQAMAQDCVFEACASDDCGSLNVKFSPEGGPVFCDGETIVFNNTSDTGFTYFIVDWRDGTSDTLYDNADFTHVYVVPDSLLCTGGDIVYYSVCFKGVRECANGTTCQSGTYAFGIRKRPKARFGSGNVCLGKAYGFGNQSCHATGAEWGFGDGSGSFENEPTHLYDSIGNYTVRLVASNACGTDTVFGNVAVVLDPVALFQRKSGFQAWCDTLPVIEEFGDASNEFTIYTNWNIQPKDSTKWRFTDTLMNEWSKKIAVMFLDTGTFVIELTASNDCGVSVYSETIRILRRPEVDIYPPFPTCDSVIVSPITLGLQYEGPIDKLVWIFDEQQSDTLTGFDFPPLVFDSSGRVRLYVHGPCGIELLEVPVSAPQTSDLAFPNFPSFHCINAPPIQLEALPPGGFWSGIGPAQGSVTPEGLFDASGLVPGTYLLRYGLDSVYCQTDTLLSVEIRQPPGVFLTPPDPVCGSLLYTPDVSYIGHISSYQWSFPGANPPVSTKAQPTNVFYAFPGIFTVIIQATGSCGMDADTVQMQIQAPLNLKINPVPPPLCSNSPPFLLSANQPGGVWSGPGVIDPVSGLFDPAAVPGDQPVMVSYALKLGVCEDTASLTLTVNVPQPVSVADRFFCIDNPSALLQASQPGGTWSGPGIIQPLFGQFSPAAAGLGVHLVRYDWKDAKECVSSDSAFITVEEVPQITLNDTTLFCFVPKEVDLVSTTGFSASPPGGTVTWSGPGVDPLAGTFNPVKANLSTGTYKIEVTYKRNGCEVKRSTVITLILFSPLAMPPDTAICISEGALPLSATPKGGTWSGPGINAVSGVIDLLAAGGGIQTYTYLLHPGTSCEQTGQVQVEIIDPGGVAVPGPDLGACVGTDTITFSGFSPAGGTWSGPALLDSLAGTVDIGQLAAGTYTFEYCLESQTHPGCVSCRPRTLTVHPPPVIAFGFEGYPCVNAPFTIIDSTSNAATYFWDFGDGSTSTLPEPQYAYTKEGTYTMTLFVTSINGCRDTFQQDFFITYPPTATFDLLSYEGCAPFPIEIVNNSEGYNITQTWYIQGDTIVGPDPGPFQIDNITSDSVFQVVLEVSNQCGTELWIEEVLVHPYPVVDFGFNVPSGCSPLAIEFANVSLGNPDNFQWDLGNGVPFSGPLPPPQVYETTDSVISYYPVTLISTNECGADTLTQTITVYPPDVRAFIGLDSLAGCQPLSLQPQDLSTPGSKVSWKVFSENDSLLYATVEGAPTFILEEPGWYTIILFAARCGVDTDTARVFVTPAPQVSFTHLPYACEDSEVNFQNGSVNTAGQLWDFGDGVQSTAFAPSHAYAKAGIYTVTLTGYSLFNNCPATVTSQVEILPKPAAVLSASDTLGCSPLTVQFANASSGNGSLEYVWTFGDGSSADLSAEPLHVFEKPGDYLVTLRAYDIFGCYSDSANLVVKVYPSPVGGILPSQASVCYGQEPLLLQSGYPDAVTFDWLIDGQSFSTQVVQWTPQGTGPVDAMLVVRNLFGCIDTARALLDVLPSPIAIAGLDKDSGCEDLRIQFSNQSQNGSYFLWDFGEGSTSLENDPAFLFQEPGSYTVQLVAFQSNGCPPDTAQVNVTVHPLPVAAIDHSIPEPCGVPQEVQFTNASMLADTWLWRFGDGNSTPLQDPKYFYQKPGEYMVSLEVATVQGCRDTAQRIIRILGQPVADFELPLRDGCSPFEVPVANLTTDALSYEWQVEGVGTFSGQNPMLRFDKPGVYSVRLIAKYTDACVDTFELADAITVYQGPLAGFDVAIDPEENVLGDVVFTNTSLFSERYYWDLGDGTTDTATHVAHVYDINRSIRVVLYAYNDNNGVVTCVDSVVQYIDPEWITTFFAPNAMTPGYGEEGTRIFKPVGIGIEEYEISIYSPWGELVWYSTALENHRPSGFWDGTHRGQDVPQGAYAWIARMRFLNGAMRTVKGTVTVLR